MTKTDMAAYGLTERWAALAREWGEERIAGRILSQERGAYRLICEAGERFAEVSGKFRFNAAGAADFPTVGDFVVADRCAPRDNAVIHAVLPRKSVFMRRAAGSENARQLVAANIDTLFICMSLNHDFNLRRLERYLTVAWESGASPVIVLTKADLCADAKSRIREIEPLAMGADIVVTTAMERGGHEKLLPYISPGRTAALTGSSGVGKSTLINRLLGEERLETNGLRNDDRGRHTTTRRELFLLAQGGMIIDTPGMRELGMWEAEDGLERSFADIEQLARQCRFRDCSHTSEPGCAVRAAVESGALSRERLRSYEKLTAENRYSENAGDYLSEKEQKFKSIAKINRARRGK